jgi:hypothetical protein
MTTNTTTTGKPAAVQFTNASERAHFLKDSIARLAGETGLNPRNDADYQKLFGMACRANPALCVAMKRSAMNAASEPLALTTAQKVQFLNSEMDSIAAARGITDPAVKKASQGILRKLTLERRPDLAPKRSAHAACDIFSKPPPLIGSHSAHA